MGLGTAAGSFAVAFQGEEADNWPVVEGEIGAGFPEDDITEAAAEALRHDQCDRDAGWQGVHFAHERGGVQIFIAPEVVERGLVLVPVRGAVAGEV